MIAVRYFDFWGRAKPIIHSKPEEHLKNAE
jgi:hypothetical protein